MTSGRVVELCRAYQDHILDGLHYPRQHTRTPLHPAALASMPYGIVLVRVRVRHLALLMIGGYGEADWPSA